MDAIAWSGTSSSWLGFDRDLALCRAIQAATGILATSSILALNEALEWLGVRRLALVTPYTDDVQARITANFAGIGIHCTARRNLGLHDNFSFAEVTEAQLDVLIREAALDEADAVAIVCTNLRAAPLVQQLEAALGVPVLDSVATALWGALHLAGADPGRITSAFYPELRQPRLPSTLAHSRRGSESGLCPEKHGRARRQWRKLHGDGFAVLLPADRFAVGVDAGIGETAVHMLTDEHVDDAARVPALLGQVEGGIVSVTADRAYDGEPTYAAAAARQRHPPPDVVVSPRASAVPSSDGSDGASQSPCNRHIQLVEPRGSAAMAECGRIGWQQATGYGRRNQAEMVCMQTTNSA